MYTGGLVNSDYKDDDGDHEEELPRWPHPRGCCDRVSLIALPQTLCSEMHSALCFLHFSLDKVLVEYGKFFRVLFLVF